MTVDVSAVRPNGCRTELGNTSPNLSALALLPRNAYFLPVGANLPPRPIPSTLLLIQPIGLHLIQKPVCAQHYDDSRFSVLAQGRSPFHLSALEATFITKLSQWSFSSQSRLGFFLYIAASFPALSILTVLLDKCQTKSFEYENSNQSNSQH